MTKEGLNPGPTTTAGADSSGDSPAGTSITWDSQGQPISQRFDDVYFSKLSGIDESRYVFLDHNKLSQRWHELADDEQFVIAETGFGTGLNFLATWDLWRSLAPPSAHLHFISVEKYPLSSAQLEQALQLWPQLAELAKTLIQAYPPMPASGFHRLTFDGGRVQLTLILDDALAGLQQLLPLTRPGPHTQTQQPTWAGTPLSLDAIYLDGFAPAKNPDMWSQPLFSVLATLSKPGTTFATFTAASQVRRGLADAGFQVTKTSGFGHKRHMLYGTLSSESAVTQLPRTHREKFQSAWHTSVRSAGPATERRALVIGAGLAGCHSARALAEKGFKVTLLEKQRVASGASGNSQGVVYAKASIRKQPLTQFNIAALQFACRYYQTHLGYQTCGDACGVVHVAQSAKQAAEYQALAAHYQQEPTFVRWIPQQLSQAECGVPLSGSGLLFPQAGWLDPRALCRELLDHPNIGCQEQAKVKHIAYTRGQWCAFGDDDKSLAQAPILIIANASDALRLKQTAHLPIKPIRGQVTEVAVSANSRALTRVLCGRGYLAPAHNESHCLGASFNLRETSPLANPEDDQENLAHIAELSPRLNDWNGVKTSRVSFRCTTPDYLPLVGAAPIADDFTERFAKLRRSARTIIDDTGSYYPGLFINLGHGSRGLTYTPLCAELLASMITGTPLPLARDMMMYLHPARFLIRDLKRRRL